MRRYRRRRKPVVWLPNTGTQLSNAGTILSQSSAIIFAQGITIANVSSTVVVETPMVLDNPQGADLAAFPETLAQHQTRALDEETDFGYTLKRIVGSLHIGLVATSALAGSSPAAVLVQAGLIVRRVDDSGNSFAAATVDDSDPGNLRNNTDPWIWRRDWVLTPIQKLLAAGSSTLLPAPDAGDTFAAMANQLPNINDFQTGPNGTSTVDTRIARRIGPEERLFFDLAFSSLNLDPQKDAQNFSAFVVFPYRVLGTLRLMGGNRRNASR